MRVLYFRRVGTQRVGVWDHVLLFLLVLFGEAGEVAMVSKYGMQVVEAGDGEEEVFRVVFKMSSRLVTFMIFLRQCRRSSGHRRAVIRTEECMVLVARSVVLSRFGQRLLGQRQLLCDLQQDEEDSAKRHCTEAELISALDTEYDGEEEQIGTVREEKNSQRENWKDVVAVSVGLYSFAICCREEGKPPSRDEEVMTTRRAMGSGAGGLASRKCRISLICTTLSRISRLVC